jgi:DNA-binding NarL/FixJ family response regulator
MPHKITVLLADDHALVRRGFRRMWEDDPGISVVGEASDGLEAVRLAKELKPRVIVMDCAMPELNGIEATRKIRHEPGAPKVIALSMHTDRRFTSEMIKAARLSASMASAAAPSAHSTTWS